MKEEQDDETSDRDTMGGPITDQPAGASEGASPDQQAQQARCCCGDGLGGLEILALDQSAECVGCGNEKRHRSKPAESMVCCGDCWRRMPQWAKDGFANDTRRPEAGPEHGATIWQNRLSILLQWMRDADSPNTQPIRPTADDRHRRREAP